MAKVPKIFSVGRAVVFKFYCKRGTATEVTGSKFSCSNLKLKIKFKNSVVAISILINAIIYS